MKADGFSPDDKRSPVTENDIPDILTRFHNPAKETSRARTEQSFFVSKTEIAQNNYDLSINRYKEIVHEKIEYDKPDVILTRIDTLIADIAKQTQTIKEMLNG